MRVVRVGAKELLEVRASQVLAVDPRVLASGTQIADAPPPTEERSKVAIVSVIGPLAQRAVADLCGYVDGYDAVTARFAKAIQAPEVGAVVLRIDSPGGDVAGLEEAIGRMVELRKKSRKPVYAYVDELAASAAYWLAAGVSDSGVFVPGSGLVGSIGAIGALVDATKAAEAEGLKVTLVRDPAGKAEAHPYGPDQALAEERLGKLVAAAAGRFTDAVASLRGLKAAAVRGLNGALLEGEQAVTGKLADGVASLEDVVAMAAAEASRRKSMKNTRAKLGLSESATDEEVERALDAEVADAKFGRGMRAKLAVETNEAAEKLVDELVATQAQAEAARAKNEQELAARAKVERRAAIATLVKLGKETPATAWVDPTARELEPKGSLATMPLAELQERVAAFASEPRVLDTKRPLQVSGEGLTEKELATCKAKGIDPAKYAATKAEMNRKSGHRAAEAI